MSDDEIIALLREADRQREHMQRRLAVHDALAEARELVLVEWVRTQLRLRNN